MIKLAVILLLAVLLLSVFSSVSYVKKASAAECPSGQIKDWAGICFNKSEAKACPTCAPGSAAAAEKPKTPPPKVEVITIPPPAEKPQKSTSPPRTITIPAPNQCTKPPCTVTVTAPKGNPPLLLGGAIMASNNPHSLKNLVNAGIDAVKKAWDNRPTLNQMVNSLYPQGDGGGDTGRCLDINQNPIPNCNPNE
jgi:hypothetical protein